MAFDNIATKQSRRSITPEQPDDVTYHVLQMFQSPDALASVYPNLLRHGMTTFGSPDVLRFFGQIGRLKSSRQAKKPNVNSTKVTHQPVRGSAGRTTTSRWDMV